MALLSLSVLMPFGFDLQTASQKQTKSGTGLFFNFCYFSPQSSKKSGVDMLQANTA